MKRKLLIVISVLGTMVLLTMLCFSVYYISAFDKLNRAIIQANKTNTFTQKDAPVKAWISYEDLISLKITKHTLSDSEYVQLKTKKTINHLSLKMFTVSVDIYATVNDLQTGDIIEKDYATKTVELKFDNFQWNINQVQQHKERTQGDGSPVLT